MRWLVVVGASALLACGGSPGTINNAQPAASFVRSNDLLYFYSGGIAQIRLDGSDRKVLFSASYRLLDMAQDASVFVLGDKHTNLYVADGRTQTVRKVTALNRRASTVALSPDGQTLAVTRHADYSGVRLSRPNSDAIYVIDIKTLSHRVIAKHTKQIVTSLGWSKDGTKLSLAGHSNKQRIDVRTGSRTVVTTATSAKDLHRRLMRNRPRTCDRLGATLLGDGFRGDKGLKLQTSAGTRQVVTVSGRKRGFHDYLPTLRNAFFNHGCDYGVFEFRGRVWVVELASGKVGPLSAGSGAFLGASAPNKKINKPTNSP